MRAAVGGGLVGLALFALAPDAVAASTRTVTVNDSSVDPIQANVVVGDSVRWVNRGTRSHRVASVTRAWRAFVLRRGASKRVRFAKKGCFRYTVDANVRGRVAVSARCGGNSGGETTSTGSTTFRYVVTVSGSAHMIQTHSGDSDPGANGIVDLDLTWTGRFADVRVRKVAAANTYVLAPPTATGSPGTMTPVFKFAGTRPTFGGPCSGTVEYGPLAARSFAGGIKASTGIEFTAVAQLTAASGQTVFDTAIARQGAACRDHMDFFPNWIRADVVRAGITWDSPITLLTMNAHRRGAGAVFSPLNRLAAGDAFTLDTGPLQETGACRTGPISPVCVETVEGRLRMVFTPRR